MKILSIDTSSKICAVAILENKLLIKEFNIDSGLTHSEKLMPIIEQILLESNLNLSNIDLLVSDIGPGSFTGIRIGSATTMAFADSLSINCIGISSLEALAYNVKTDGIICSLIDAKHSNCYYGIYKLEKGMYTLIDDLSIENIDIILNKFKKYNGTITFVGTGAVVYKELIIEHLSDYKFVNNNNLNAYNLGVAGLNAYLNKKYHDVKPLYLRKPQAERVLEEKSNANTNK